MPWDFRKDGKMNLYGDSRHKIIAIFPMYELGIMAYDVAVISCLSF